jgi:quercetin dioxygenase-like cupin family protein
MRSDVSLYLDRDRAINPPVRSTAEPLTGRQQMGNEDIIRTGEVLVREMELSDGSATEWHSHSRVHDYFVCLEGKVKVETRNPDSAIVLEPGQRYTVPTGQVHRVVNLDGRISKYLLVQGVGKYDFCKEQL